MRLLALTLYPPQAASPRYRIHQFLPALRTQGIEVDVRSAVSDAVYRQYRDGTPRRAAGYHLHETRRRITQLLRARRYDAVILQKAPMSAYLRGMGEFIRARSRRLILDIDDAVHLAPPHPLPRRWRWLENRAQVQHLMAKADVVLAGNRWLADEVTRLGGNAIHFPTVVDTDRFVPAPPPDTYRLGWMGSPSTAPALNSIAHPLASAGAGEVCIIGATFADAAIEGAVYRPWSEARELEDLQSFAVGLMPLPRDAWSRGKCGLKALQAMACGVPCIASRYGAAEDIIRHETDGLLAGTEAEWSEAIDRLRDSALRRRLGTAARERVESTYALCGAAPRLVEIIQSIQEPPKSARCGSVSSYPR